MSPERAKSLTTVRCGKSRKGKPPSDGELLSAARKWGGGLLKWSDRKGPMTKKVAGKRIGEKGGGKQKRGRTILEKST